MQMSALTNSSPFSNTAEFNYQKDQRVDVIPTFAKAVEDHALSAPCVKVLIAFLNHPEI